MSAPVLIRPDPEKPFVLITDWQSEAISAILAQVGPGGLECEVEYSSKSVPACKCNNAAPTGECYAALWGIMEVTWTRIDEHQPCIEYLELLIVQVWRTDVEGDLLGFLFGSVRPGHRQLIAQELVIPLAQLVDYLSLDIVSQSDERPAPHVLTRTLALYLQWTACLEEPGSESTLPSRQEYLKPSGIINLAFYPKQEEAGEEEATEEEDDAEDETSEEGSYSEHSEGEQSVEEEEDDEEEEEEEAGLEWEALPEEVASTGTKAEDPEAARKREEIAAGKSQLEFASEANLCINDDPTRDLEPPKPEDGDPATAAPSASRRRRSRSPSPSTSARPSVRPRTDAGDRPSSPVIIPLSP
ncbi:hypothetical protein CBR_g24258 [Chara braunii]|uniref:Reverse transcriptase/retrotransposon-derived protein RNase H-like domain-containing protein n=1 Tax=Chara braunii TaxID=69332 RepID=A0A388JM80_CHABU|nr:hypothetical protein CBR_g24258 [Chara braunii]|eukprot:GBG58907.1 hypothetical protein CBR_g24258 [Chara braunii]